MGGHKAVLDFTDTQHLGGVLGSWPMIVFGLIATFGSRKYYPQREVVQIDIFALYSWECLQVKKGETQINA